MKKNIISALILLLLFKLDPSFASERTLILFDDSNPPFMFQKHRAMAGLYPTIIKAAFKRMQLNFQLAGAPWPRALAALDDNTAAVGGIYKTSERLKKYDFSVPLYTECLGLYVLTTKSFPFKKIDDLNGKTIGAIEGWSLGEDFDAARAQGKLKVTTTGSDQQNFEKLELGRVDAVVAVREAGDLLMKKYAGKIERLPNVLTENEAYLAFNKKSHSLKLLNQFNATIAEMKKDGTFDLLLKQALH